MVASVATDPLIPLITSVPVSGTPADASAFIARQHGWLATGAGYSWCIADVAEDRAVGQIGVWLRDHDKGRVSVGDWIAGLFRRRGFAGAASRAATRFALTLDGVSRVELYVEPRSTAPIR